MQLGFYLLPVRWTVAVTSTCFRLRIWERNTYYNPFLGTMYLLIFCDASYETDDEAYEDGAGAAGWVVLLPFLWAWRTMDCAYRGALSALRSSMDALNYRVPVSSLPFKCLIVTDVAIYFMPSHVPGPRFSVASMFFSTPVDCLQRSKRRYACMA